MRLTIEPKPSLPQFSSDLDLVIVTTDDDRIPEIFVTEGSPVPDRHMLLGLVQIVSVAVQEQDPESVVRMDICSMRLQRAGEEKDISPGLAIVRTEEGQFAVLGVGDLSTMKRLTRNALRWFTGTIRLDVP